MKNILSKLYIIVFFLCSTIAAFADPGTTNDTGDLESSDAAPMPIDDYIWVVTLIGLLFVFVKLKNMQQKKVDTIKLTTENSKKH